MPDLDPKNENIFIRARAIWCISHFSELVTDQVFGIMISALTLGISDHVPLIKISSVRSIGFICASHPPEKIVPHLSQWLNSIATMLSDAQGESLQMLLDTLSNMLNMDGKITLSFEAVITPIIIRI